MLWPFFTPKPLRYVISPQVRDWQPDGARRRSEPTRLELRRLLVWRRAGLERLTDPGGTLGSQRYHRGIIALSTCRAHPVRRRHALMNWKLRASRAMPPQPESAIIPPPSSALQNVLPDSLQPAVLADNHAGEPDEGPSRKRSRGKPAGPQKCPTCRKKSRPCGTECPDWPGHSSANRRAWDTDRVHTSPVCSDVPCLVDALHALAIIRWLLKVEGEYQVHSFYLFGRP